MMEVPDMSDATIYDQAAEKIAPHYWVFLPRLATHQAMRYILTDVVRRRVDLDNVWPIPVCRSRRETRIEPIRVILATTYSMVIERLR